MCRPDRTPVDRRTRQKQRAKRFGELVVRRQRLAHARGERRPPFAERFFRKWQQRRMRANFEADVGLQRRERTQSIRESHAGAHMLAPVAWRGNHFR